MMMLHYRIQELHRILKQELNLEVKYHHIHHLKFVIIIRMGGYNRFSNLNWTWMVKRKILYQMNMSKRVVIQDTKKIKKQNLILMEIILKVAKIADKFRMERFLKLDNLSTKIQLKKTLFKNRILTQVILKLSFNIIQMMKKRMKGGSITKTN